MIPKVKRQGPYKDVHFALILWYAAKNNSNFVGVEPLRKKELVDQFIWWNKFITWNQKRGELLLDKFIIHINVKKLMISLFTDSSKL